MNVQNQVLSIRRNLILLSEAYKKQQPTKTGAANLQKDG